MVPRASPGSIISSMHFTSAFKPSWISGECLPPPLRAVIGCIYLGMFLTLSSFFVSPQLCFVKRTQRLWSFHWNWEERKHPLKQEAFKTCWSLVFTIQSGPGATTLQKIKINLKNWWAIRCSFFFPFRLNGTLDFFVFFSSLSVAAYFQSTLYSRYLLSKVTSQALIYRSLKMWTHGQRSLVGYSPWGGKSWTRLSDKMRWKNPVFHA